MIPSFRIRHSPRKLVWGRAASTSFPGVTLVGAAARVGRNPPRFVRAPARLPKKRLRQPQRPRFASPSYWPRISLALPFSSFVGRAGVVAVVGWRGPQTGTWSRIRVTHAGISQDHNTRGRERGRAREKAAPGKPASLDESAFSNSAAFRFMQPLLR